MIAAEGLDPVGFVLDELAARGALVERTSPDAAAAIVSPEVAAALGVPEVAALTSAPTPDAVFCGLGSPVLDRLITDARRAPALAAVRWTAEPPRPAVAEGLAGRLIVRNGVAEVVGTGPATATYLIAALAWTAEADDRYQGLVTLVLDAATGAEPDALTQTALARVLEGHEAEEIAWLAGATAGTDAVLARRGGERVRAGLGAIEAAVARRRDREVDRQAVYFLQLLAEARRPRRQVARGVIAARVAAIEAEADAKRRDLEARYALRVRVAPAAIVAVTARVAEVRLRLRRRKQERELLAHVPPGARHADALACAACTATTRAFILCDDALHVLCEACAPLATGRPHCGACAPRSRRS